MTARTVACALVALLVTAGVAAAQPDDAQRKAAAEAAFRQGKDLLAQGKTEQACMAFKQSLQLDRQFGTQYNLALCYTEAGKLASAWGELTELAAKDTNLARRADAGKRAKALEPRLIKLLIKIEGRVPGLTIRRGDSDVTPFMGVPTPVDPGAVTLSVTAPGYKPWSQEVTLEGEGQTITVDVPPLEKEPEPPPDDGNGGTGGTGGPGDGTGGGEIMLPPPPPPSSSRKTIGLVTGGVGLAAVGVGVLFGMRASSQFDEAKVTCGGDVTDCRGDVFDAQDSVSSARTSALISNISIGVGAAAVIGGVVLFLTAPGNASPERATLVPVVGSDQAGVAVHGRF